MAFLNLQHGERYSIVYYGPGYTSKQINALSVRLFVHLSPIVLKVWIMAQILMKQHLKKVDNKLLKVY